MNERIKELAEEAGLDIYPISITGSTEELEAFAELVEAAARADEREKCARKASIALLGANKALTDRVLKAIRARGTT